MRAKDWLIFISLLLLGFILYEIEHFQKPSWLELSLGKYSGYKSIRVEEKEYNLLENPNLILKGNIGSIRISPARDNKLKIKWEKVIYERDNALVDKVASSLVLSIKQVGNEVSIFTNASEVESKYGRGIKNNFEITIPVRANVSIENKMGDILIRNIEGEIKVENSFGKILITNGFVITAKQKFGSIEIERVKLVSIIASEFSKVRLHELSGTINVDGKYSKVYLSKIKGFLTLDLSYGLIEGDSILEGAIAKVKHMEVVVKDSRGEFDIDAAFANINLRNIENKVVIKSKHSPIILDNIKGDIDITASFKDIEIRKIKGWCKIEAKHASIKAIELEEGAKITNSFEDVYLEEAYGKVVINTHHSDAIVKNSEKKYNDIIISAKYGDIDLEIPEMSSLKVKASVYKGKIENQFDKEIFIQEEKDDNLMLKSKERKGTSGSINLHSEYGDIIMKKFMPSFGKKIETFLDFINSIDVSSYLIFPNSMKKYEENER